MSHKLIIIRGSAGIGKSTISKILADRIGGKTICIDEVLKRAKLDKIDPRENRIPVANFLAIQEDVLAEIEKYLERYDVVVEGNFYYKEQIDFFEKIFKKDLFVVSLKAKLETCIRRDLKRKSPLGKKSTEEVYDLVSAFDAGFVVDTEQKPREQIVESIQEELKNLNENN